MTDIERIRDQLQQSIEGDPWHGPSLMKVLDGLTPAEAASRPVNDAHSIWELVNHIIAWMNEARVRIATGKGRDLPPEDDFPAQPEKPTDKDWQATVADIKRAVAQLAEALDDSVGARLDEPIAEGFSPVYHTLYGIIQHNTYHGGQIAILRKAL